MADLGARSGCRLTWFDRSPERFPGLSILLHFFVAKSLYLVATCSRKMEERESRSTLCVYSLAVNFLWFDVVTAGLM